MPRLRWLIGRLRREEDGFSLVELLVVIAIIAVLSVIVSLSLGGLAQRATAARDQANRASVQAAVDAYYASTGGQTAGPWYPTTDHNPGAVLTTAADGAGGTFVPMYVRSMPTGTWSIDANGLVSGP